MDVLTYKAVLWTFVLAVWRSHETNAQVVIRTYVLCLNAQYPPTLRINCPSGTRMWINRAYIGKPVTDPPEFCSFPSSDPQRDCIKFERQRTDQLLLLCSKIGQCTMYLGTYYSLASCDNAETTYTGTPYIAVEYLCYSNLVEGTSKSFRYVNIETMYAQDVGNRALLQSNLYQLAQWQTGAQGGCQVTLPADSYLVAHIMDFRARFINTIGQCPAEVVLHSGETWVTICGKQTWSYKNYTLEPAPGSSRVDISYQTIGENSEGRLEILIEGRAISGGFIQEMNLNCGRNIQMFSTTTSTTSTTTSEVTAPDPQTTTTPPKITTTQPATTTTFEATTEDSRIAIHSTYTVGRSSAASSWSSSSYNSSSVSSGSPLSSVADLSPAREPDFTQPMPTSVDITENATLSSVRTSVMSKVVVGAAIGGAVFVVIVIVSLVFACTQRSRNQRRTKPRNNQGNDVIMAFENSNRNKSTSKKIQNSANRQYNPYIMNNQRQSGHHGTGEEYYSEIEDSRGPQQRHWLQTDNRNINATAGVTAGTHFPAADPAFDKPTESTLKMAQGTTRGFNY